MIRKALVGFLALAIVTSCGDRRSRLKVDSSKVEGYAAEAAYDAQATSQGQALAPITERKLIKTGDLTFETSDIKKTKGEIDVICKELNAYISNENQNNYGERLQYSQIIRVPANLFDSLLSRIESGALKVENKNIHTQDVTEEFIDVEARLKTKKALEARYSEILKQAKTVQDIVTIEGQIATVRSEIESMEGRLQYLQNQVSFSTLNVSYYEVIGTDFGFASKLVRALGQGWDNLLLFLIGLVNIWPFVLLVPGIFWGISVWRKRKKNQSPT